MSDKSRRLTGTLQRVRQAAGPEAASARAEARARRAEERERRLQHVVDALRAGPVGVDRPRSA